MCARLFARTSVVCAARPELIDLYTPTTDAKQYVTYMKLLFSAVTEGTGIRFRWQKPRKRAAAGALVASLRAEMGGSTGGWEALSEEERLALTEAKFAEWVGAREAARVKDEADGDGSGGGSDSGAVQPAAEPVTEIDLYGFHAACERLLPEELCEPSDQDEERHLIDVLCARATPALRPRRRPPTPRSFDARPTNNLCTP